MPGRIAKSPPPAPVGFGPKGSDVVRLTGDDFSAVAPTAVTFRGFSSYAEPPLARARPKPRRHMGVIVTGGVVMVAIAAIGISWIWTQPEPAPALAPAPRPVVAAPPQPLAQLAAIEPASPPPAPKRRPSRPAAKAAPEITSVQLIQPEGSPVSPVVASETQVLVITPPPATTAPVQAAPPSPAPDSPETSPS
jgi:hypothetical protein